MKTIGRLFVVLLVVAAAPLPLFAQQEFSGSYNTGDVGSSRSAPADPRSRAKIHSELGALYFQAGNPAAALDHLAMALDIDSRFFLANSVRGLVYASLGENDKAEKDFSRALSLAPNDPEVNNNYGWFLCETGKGAESIAYFMKAVRDPLYETPDRAYTNAGNCALKIKDNDRALEYFLNALRVARDGAVPARLGLARLLFQNGNFSESRLYLGEALRMMEPPTPEALWLGIRLERKLGNRATESGFAAQLRSRYPASSEYQEFLKGNFE